MIPSGRSNRPHWLQLPDGPIRGSVVFAPDDIIEAVAFLSVDKGPRGQRRRVEIGTCFLVTVWNASRSAGFNYIVTAKHVVASFIGKQEIYLRINKMQVHPGTSGVLHTRLNGGWVFHSDDTVDLAVLPWTNDVQNVEAASLPFDGIVAIQDFITSKGLSWPPSAGEDVVFVGLLHHHVGMTRNMPIVRRGHLAMTRREKVEGACGPSDYYLLDLQAYPGHSGGPTWVAVGNTLCLLGVLSAAFPTKQEILSRPSSGRGAPNVTEYYNLGISLVTPVEKLTEILMSEPLKAERAKNEPRPVRTAVPLRTTAEG